MERQRYEERISGLQGQIESQRDEMIKYKDLLSQRKREIDDLIEEVILKSFDT